MSGGLSPAVTVSIAGWLGCGYYGRAKTALLGLNVIVPSVQVEVSLYLLALLLSILDYLASIFL